jgi:hypothetical protein
MISGSLCRVQVFRSQIDKVDRDAINMQGCSV